MARDGKARFFKIMLEDELITEDEFRMMLWYLRNVKSKVEKEIK